MSSVSPRSGPVRSREHGSILGASWEEASWCQSSSADILTFQLACCPRSCHHPRIDPDRLALLLPERPQYLSAFPSLTSTLLHPEASLLQELLTSVARSLRRSIVVDGSLSCSDWFSGVMRSLVKDGYGVEILFVFAEEERMRERAGRRERATGRRVTDEQVRSLHPDSPLSPSCSLVVLTTRPSSSPPLPSPDPLLPPVLSPLRPCPLLHPKHPPSPSRRQLVRR